jgi:hypothetical protein
MRLFVHYDDDYHHGIASLKFIGLVDIKKCFNRYESKKNENKIVGLLSIILTFFLYGHWSWITPLIRPQNI